MQLTFLYFVHSCTHAHTPAVCLTDLFWVTPGQVGPDQTTTTTIILWPFVRDYPAETVPEETFTHPPSWSSSSLYQLLPSTGWARSSTGKLLGIETEQALTGWTLFFPKPNQQCQSTEWNSKHCHSPVNITSWLQGEEILHPLNLLWYYILTQFLSDKNNRCIPQTENKHCKRSQLHDTVNCTVKSLITVLYEIS